jgi:hypothetical protein
MVAAESVTEVQALSLELQSAIREYVARMRQRVTRYAGENRRSPIRKDDKSLAKSAS